MKSLKCFFLILIISNCTTKDADPRLEIMLDSMGDTVATVSFKGTKKDGPLTRYGANNRKVLIEFYENDIMKKKVYYYENGTVRSEGPVLNNLPSGLWLHYYEDGNLESKINMENGKAVGEFIQYYRNGNIELKGEDFRGNGIYEKFDSLGSLILKLRYKENEVVDTLEMNLPSRPPL